MKKVTLFIKTIKILLFLVLVVANKAQAQELFISTQQASTMPKKVWSYRVFGTSYTESGTQRNMMALRLQYGLTATTTVMLTASVANHHDKILPPDLINHTHVGNQTIYGAQNIKRGVSYPYLFNGFNINLKQRLLSIDGAKSHFRIAALAGYSNVVSAHDEAEANLLHDNKGWSLGLSTTVLKNRFATALTANYVIPGVYKEESVVGEINPEKRHLEMHYGNLWEINLAFGYLLYPRKYTSYEQDNWNVYTELFLRNFDAVAIKYNNQWVEDKNNSTSAGSYIDIQPGIQKIINSRARLELGVTLPLLLFAHHVFIYYGKRGFVIGCDKLIS